VHGLAVPHVPVLVQTSTELLAHCIAPGAHVPEQTPETHA
jgi:hypothetical protein